MIEELTMSVRSRREHQPFVGRRIAEQAGPLSKQIARNIARLRHQQGVSLVEMSRRLTDYGRPINRLGLQRIEQAERRLTADEIAAVAAVLGVANPWDLTAETCETCGNAPPVGFRCVTCDREGQIV